MSSIVAFHSRKFAYVFGACAGLTAFSSASAQDEASPPPSIEAIDAELPASETPPERERIDIMITVPRNEPSDIVVKECEDQQDAAQISGAIIVCRQRGEDPKNLYSSDREKAQKRYAEETKYAGDVLTPDVAGGGIFRGPATVGGQCFIPPCPKESALLIDVGALPEAPPGSDADRIARGLPPLGQNEASAEDIRKRREALGLDAPPSGRDD